MNDNEQSAGTAKPVVGRAEGQLVTVTGVVMPDVEKSIRAMEMFEDLKSRLLIDGKDKVKIGDKTAITRSGFSKLLLAFNGSCRMEKPNRIVVGKPGTSEYDYIVHATAVAWLPNGRSCEGNSSCSLSEFRGDRVQPDIFIIEGTAATRARNRAIGDLLGGSDIVSSEEMNGKTEYPKEHQDSNSPEPISPRQKKYALDLGADAMKRQKIISLATLIENIFGKGSNIENLTKAQGNTLIEKLKEYEMK